MKKLRLTVFLVAFLLSTPFFALAQIDSSTETILKEFLTQVKNKESLTLKFRPSNMGKELSDLQHFRWMTEEILERIRIRREAVGSSMEELRKRIDENRVDYNLLTSSDEKIQGAVSRQKRFTGKNIRAFHKYSTAPINFTKEEVEAAAKAGVSLSPKTTITSGAAIKIRADLHKALSLISGQFEGLIDLSRKLSPTEMDVKLGVMIGNLARKYPDIFEDIALPFFESDSLSQQAILELGYSFKIEKDLAEEAAKTVRGSDPKKIKSLSEKLELAKNRAETGLLMLERKLSPVSPEAIALRNRALAIRNINIKSLIVRTLIICASVLAPYLISDLFGDETHLTFPEKKRKRHKDFLEGPMPDEFRALFNRKLRGEKLSDEEEKNFSKLLRNVIRDIK